MQRGVLKNRRLMVTFATVIAMLISIAVVAVVRMYGNSEVTSIDSAGGTASSADDHVIVTFAPGEFSTDTDVKILNDDRRAPLLPPGLVPIVPPFSITPGADGAHTGTVTVSLPELPDNINPESIVMSITDGNTWEVVDATVNIQAQTVTAKWPHFSWGVVWIPSPVDILHGVQAAGGTVVNGVQQGASWTWDKVHDAPGWLADRGKDIVDVTTHGIVAMMGGTLNDPECEHEGDDWTFTAPKPIGILPSALGGCIEQREEDGSWRINLVDRMPVPYLLSLPEGVELEWRQLFEAGYPLEDTLIALAERKTGRAMVYSSKTLELTVANNAPESLNLEGYVDPYSMAMKIVIAAAIIFTAGEGATVDAEANAAKTELGEILLDEARRAAADTTSRVKRIQDLVSKGHNSAIVKLAFTLLDVTNCTKAVAEKQLEAFKSERHEGFGVKKLLESMQDYTAGMITECFPLLVKGVFKSVAGDVAEIAKAVGEQLQTMIKISVTEALSVLQVATNIDYLQTNISLDRDPAVAPLPEDDTGGEPATPPGPTPSPTPGPPPVAPIQQDLDGVWEGMVDQPSSSTPYSVKLAIRVDSGHLTGVVEYPELRCSGTVDGSVTPTGASLTETITVNVANDDGGCIATVPEIISFTSTGIQFGSVQNFQPSFISQLTRSACNPSCTLAGRTFDTDARDVEGISQTPAFTTPSGNIKCVENTIDSGIMCVIWEHDFPAGECINQPGPMVYLRASGSATINPCINDGLTKYPNPGTLPYNSPAQIGGALCFVSEAQLRCSNSENHGFTLSRANYTAF